MLLPYPRCAVTLLVHFMIVTQLVRYQCMETPKTPAEAIRYLSKTAGCELPIKCSEVVGKEMCCYDCSECPDTLCSHHWQCCPDGFRDVKGLLGDAAGDSLQPFPDGLTPQCMKVFTSTNKGSSVVTPESFSYKMIATCRDGSQQHLKHLCTTNEGGPLINRIPVMDVNNYMYRNIHCLQCNFGTISKRINLALSRRPLHLYNQFKSLKIDRKSDFSIFSMSSIQTTDELVMSATLYYTGVRYPPCGISNDIWHCNNSNGPNLPFSKACELFGSDHNAGIRIKVKDPATPRTYMAKNIACAYCFLGDNMALANSDGADRMKRCRLEYQPKRWLMMNPVLLTDDIDPKGGIITHLQHNAQSSCGQGYFYDKVRRQCRLILCPRHHFIYQGTCHPTFTHSVGQCYLVKVKVTAVFTSFYIPRIGKEVFNALFADTAKFNLCKLKSHGKAKKMWLGTRDPEYLYVIFEMVVCPRAEMTYKDILGTVKPFLDSDFRLLRHSQFHPYLITGVHHVYFTNSGGAKDFNDQTLLKSQVWPVHTIDQCATPIQLTHLDVCYRVQMNHSDSDHRRSNSVNGESWETVDDDTVAMCIKKYDPLIVIKDTNVRDDNVDTGDVETVKVFDFQIVIIITIVCVVILFACIIASMFMGNAEEFEDVSVTDESGEVDENGVKEKKRKVVRRPVPNPWAEIGL